MDKATAALLTDPEAYAQARELAMTLGGESAARRIVLLPPDQVRNFLVHNT